MQTATAFCQAPQDFTLILVPLLQLLVQGNALTDAADWNLAAF